MNKKLIKSIVSIACGLGATASITFVTSLCACAKKITKISLPANEVFIMDEGQLSGLKVDFTDPEIYQKYSNCNTVTIPSNISLIVDWAFDKKLPDYIKYVQVEDNNSLVTIDEHAFDGLKELVDVDLSNCTKLTTLAKFAFDECSSLTNVKLPSSLSNIADYAFNDCISLKSINLPLSLTQIGQYSFSSTDLSNIDISQCKNLTKLGSNAFSFCKNLKSFIFNNSVDTIPSGFFQNCDNLKSISITNKIKIIGASAFSECKNLSQITFDNISSYLSITVNNNAFNKIAASGTIFSKNSSIRAKNILEYLQGKNPDSPGVKGNFPTTNWESKDIK